MTNARPDSDHGDRWFMHTVRRSQPLAPGEERQLVGALDAHRSAIARHVIGSTTGLAFLRDVREALAARTADVRDVIEAEADQRVEDARARVLRRLERIERVAAARDEGAPLPQRVLDELRALRLRRVHVERIMGTLAAEARRARGARRAELAESLTVLDSTSRDAAIARARLVESHRRLVAALARRHMHRGLDLPDLVQEGTIGLLRAADKFEVAHGVAFATYAGWWIRQTIGRAIGSQGRQIRLPAGVEEGLRLVHVHRRRLTTSSGRHPSADELAADAGVPVARIADLLEVERTVAAPAASIDEPATDDAKLAIADTLADETQPGPEAQAVAGSLTREVRAALRTLTPREQRILRLRYGFGRCVDHTLEEIGHELGLTRQRILQIANRALKKIRESHHACPLQSFLES